MTTGSRTATWIVAHSAEILVIASLITVVLGIGVFVLEADTSLGQFEDQSPERAALSYAAANFSADDGENRTEVLVGIETGDDMAISRTSLAESLRLQQDIRTDPRVTPTLADERPTLGIANLIAVAILRSEELEELENRTEDIRVREAALRELRGSLRNALEEIRATQREFEALNASYERGEINGSTYANRSNELESEIEETVRAATADLTDTERRRFERAARTVMATESVLFGLDRDEFDTDAEYERAVDRLNRDLAAGMSDGTTGVLQDRIEELGTDARELRADRRALTGADPPPVRVQLEALQAANRSTFERARDRVFAEESPIGQRARDLLPEGSEPGNATAHLLVVGQTVEPSGPDRGIDALEERHHAGQRAIASHVAAYDASGAETYYAFGYGLLVDELDRALVESFRLAGGMAIVSILAVLWLVYRDPLDVVITIVGLVLVLLWTLGFMGWAGVDLNQAVATAPLLIAGLSIDFGVHVLTRYRERRDSELERDRAMMLALSGIGPVLVLVTVTTAIGFLANLVNPVGPVRAFGLVSAVGIVGSLLVFGLVVPAARHTLYGWSDRERSTTRTQPKAGRRALGSVAAVTIRRPAVLVVLVLVVTSVALGAGTAVDTEFRERDYFADPLPWSSELPEPLSMSAAETRDAYFRLQDTFGGRGERVQLLVRGDVTGPETLTGIQAIHERVIAMDTMGGRADAGGIDTPLDRMRALAHEEPAYGARFGVADVDNDGLPDRNVGSLYHGLFEWEPRSTAEVVHRDESGRIAAVRLLIDVDTGADSGAVTDELDELAMVLEDSGADIEVVPTGDLVVDHRLERGTLRALVLSFLLSTVAVLGVLAFAGRVRTGAWSLGANALVPVVLTTCWIVGTMAMLDIPLNALTATIASLAVGLGIAYSIHVTGRYVLELDRCGDPEQAIGDTLRGTGWALIGSGATSVAGVATLTVASVPVLRQFGAVAGLMILYAALASVLVLPALLVLWSRAVGGPISPLP